MDARFKVMAGQLVPRAPGTSRTARCQRACWEAQRPTGNGLCVAGTHVWVSPSLGISQALRQTGDTSSELKEPD